MPRILIVEDERSLVAALRRGLEDERHVVDVAADGPAGLAAARLEPHDVILLDVMLPGLDGLALCRALRKEGIGAPILMLTAKDTPEDIVAGLDAGADDYLTKPFAFGVLLARIRSLLRRGQAGGAHADAHRAGALEIDAAAHRVRADGVEVALTAKEFQLLEVLVRRRGTVLSRDALVESAWPREVSPESNAVEVHIAGIRKKLGACASMIHTVRGVGYVLRVEDGEP